MRRRPDTEGLDYYATLQSFAGAKRRSAAQSVHGVQPFYVSGGLTYWLTVAADDFYPNQNGVQLVTYFYVPKGQRGFIKEIRVAPYCPSPLCDPWATSGAASTQYLASWRMWGREDSGEESPLPFMGDLWRTPMGWEAAFDDDTTVAPRWTWTLKFQQGNIQRLRGQGFLNIPPFSTANPASWFLVPDIPVPAAAYPAGLPGYSAGPQWDSQRMQVLPTDKVSLHVPVPEDTTVLLFTQWRQSDVLPLAGDITGRYPYVPDQEDIAPRIPPIGPSVGSLLGYTQALTAESTLRNLERGWGG